MVCEKQVIDGKFLHSHRKVNAGGLVTEYPVTLRKLDDAVVESTEYPGGLLRGSWLPVPRRVEDG